MRQHLIILGLALGALMVGMVGGMLMDCGKDEEFDESVTVMRALSKCEEYVVDYDRFTAEMTDSLGLSAASEDDSLEREKARKVFVQFRRLCEEGRYKRAMRYYCKGDNDIGVRMHLRHVSNAYCFHKQVLLPMLQQFMEPEMALRQYCKEIEQDLSEMEELVERQAFGGGYYPAYIDEVVTDLCMIYDQLDNSEQAIRRIDEAIDKSLGMYYYATGKETVAQFHLSLIRYNLIHEEEDLALMRTCADSLMGDNRWEHLGVEMRRVCDSLEQETKVSHNWDLSIGSSGGE